MNIIQNVKAISKLFLIILLIVSAIIGALLSYLWVVGYYESLDLVYPEDVTVNITDYVFDHQNTSYFNVTIQCPTSYEQKEPANITRITVSTADDVLHSEINTEPQIPYKFQHKGESQTFKCLWNWANYTGETIKIIAFVADGSGPTFEAETPFVDLKIIDPRFDSTISVTHFNMTVQNSPSSVTHVNITDITVEEEGVTPLVPQVFPSLHPDDSVPFMCSWNWTDHQGKNVTITVKTLQGYVAYYPGPPERKTLPLPVVLTITGALFEVTNTTRFNVTVQYSEGFPQYINITRITATLKNGAPENITELIPSLPYTLHRGKSVNFTCIWNWTDYREKNVTITVYTLQDFMKSTIQATTPRVVLTITGALFNITDTSHFNVTIANSEFSLGEFVNVTRITIENGAPENLTVASPPSLNYTLYVSKSVTFMCNWNWTSHWNDDITITVYSLQGYSAAYTRVTPAPVFISDPLFNATDTSHFNITVKNHELSPSYILVTNITVTLENGTIQGVTVVAPTRLPYVLHRNEAVIFDCSWDWTDYRGKDVTITVYTLEGYKASYISKTP